MLTFAHPAGLWALLALPVVLAIHLLQRRSRRLVTSTLFLFEALRPISARGRRLERLRNSLPLWLQLLAIILLAWLLAGPRALRPDSTQRIVVVLDSSVSITAFRDELRRTLPAHLHALDRLAATTDWRLLETDPARPTLYAGRELNALLAALEGWRPHLGTHDFDPALNAAHALAGTGGLTIFVTDRPTPVPDGVESLGVGHPLDNVGWVGVTVDGDRWRALVQNHSATAQTRSWVTEVDEQPVGPRESLTLAPGQIRTLSGSFAANQTRLSLVLDADGFALDDRLPIVRPKPKPIALWIAPGSQNDAFLHRLVDSVPNGHVTPVAAGADLRLERAESNPAPGHAIRFLEVGSEVTANQPGETIAENDPLTTGVAWQGLLCRLSDPILPLPGDATLVWKGARPLVFLRGTGPDRSLLINFDLRQSNADRLPAFVVLLNRFIQSVLAEKVAFERQNVETGQPVRVCGLDASRAPVEPGFFSLRHGDDVLFEGAAHFADPREGDFRAAATFDTLAGKTAALQVRHSEEDFLSSAAALALAAVLLVSWWAVARGDSPPLISERAEGITRA